MTYQIVESSPSCAIVLAGCGAKDGAEITESVSLLINLSIHNFKTQIFAPNRDFFHVVNHLTEKEETSQSRNMLVEAARIARGQIHPLSELNSKNFDCLLFAGGFGVAKNFCNFAFKGAEAELSSDIKKSLNEFISANKVIGAICIAPVLIALIAKDLGLKNVNITLGSKDSDAANIVTSWGITHIQKSVNEACIDKTHKFVTAPAYMYDKATPADIFASAAALVKGMQSFFKE